VLAGGLVALTGAVIGLVNVAAPLVLTRLGASDFYGGVVFLIAAVLSVGTGRPLGAAVDRFGTRPALALGLLGLAVLTPLLGAGFPVQAAAAVVIALLVWNNLCYVSLATMLTRSGEAAGWSLRFATALLATVWGTGETVGAVLAGLGLDSLGSGWTTAVAGASVAVGLVVFAWMTAGGSGRRAEPENLPATGAART
jgi:predicted MFS family arabinose efflux permease